MTHLLDSNACIRYLNGRSPAVRRHLEALLPSDAVICSVVKAEMMAGALRSQVPERAIARQQELFDICASLPFDDLCALEYARVRAMLEAAGTPISHHDVEIAAVALAYGLIIVTHNVGEFGRIPGLVIEDWEAEDAG